MEQTESISISEASRFLGVSEAALRQWTDEGKIKAFVTPGGHRRYSRADLKKFVSTHSRTLGVKDLVSEIEETVELHREIARKAMRSSSLSRESQDKFADMGRNLITTVIHYITEPSRREEILVEAKKIGTDMGEILAVDGLPLADSVEIFLTHRNLIINASTSLLKRRESVTGRVVDAIPLVSNVVDETLVSLVTSHQQYRNGK